MVYPHPPSNRPLVCPIEVRLNPKLPNSCLTEVFRDDSMPEVTMLTVPPMAGSASLDAPSPR